MTNQFKITLPVAAMTFWCMAAPVHAQLLDLDLDLNIGGGSGGSASAGVSIDGSAPGANSDADEDNTPGDLPVILDQRAALEAINNGLAVPVETVMATAIAEEQGDIIDVHLISVRGFLLYELRVLGPDGDISGMYFYARNGLMIDVE